METNEEITGPQPAPTTPPPAPQARASRRPFNWIALAGFVVSFMSFSIGIFNLRWGVGLIIACVGLLLSALSFRRPRGRAWAVGGIFIAVLFIVLTFVLSKVLGLPVTRIIGL